MIEAHCRELKLPTVRRQYLELVRQAAHDGWDYEAFLLQLLEAEVLVRRDGAVARLLGGASFPDLKTLDQLNWDMLPGIELPQLSQLAASDYMERGENVAIAGPIGTDKTHLALLVKAVQRRQRVTFVGSADLVHELVEARDARAHPQASALPALRPFRRRRARVRALRQS